MKPNTKLIIFILFTLEILFVSAPKTTITDSNNVINFDNENLKISIVSEKIHIINNSGWVDFRNAGNCTGSGTYSDPYIIKDLEIDGGSAGNSILIENSNVYFKIENCTLYNAEWGSDAGISLLNVNNSHLIGNNCSYSQLGIVFGDDWGVGGGYNNTLTGNIVNNNRGGILLSASSNNILSGNTANNNTWCGIYILGSNYTVISGNTMNDNNMNGLHLAGSSNIVSGNIMNDNNMHGMWIKYSNNNTILRNTVNNNNWSGIIAGDSNYNTISGNSANNNMECGIFLFQSNYNTISGNTANYNHWGIYLYNSDYNSILGNNLIGNDECIVEVSCQGNIIQDNDCSQAPSLTYFPIILTVSLPIVGASVFIIYLNHNKFRKPQEDLEFL